MRPRAGLSPRHWEYEGRESAVAAARAGYAPHGARRPAKYALYMPIGSTVLTRSSYAQFAQAQRHLRNTEGAYSARSLCLCAVAFHTVALPKPQFCTSVADRTFRRALEAVERADLPKAVEALYTYFDCFGPMYGTGDAATQKSVRDVLSF